ncbi:glycosyltransferase family 2 protein [Sulfurimonas indica]|uniref:glycosyltransferase family 2 protein n=1 Tax=Sulfurimonas indica TaxID=2508707 RepID=UPI001264F145|nr:glycosyltransferase [Sulfurimonas indica]
MIEQNILISVVMPVYNAEKYLDEAIQSILNQTYKNFEFIIINDGSTDKSLKIIESYAKEDSRIILVSRENRGLVYSLNEGIEKAKGKYIARMDADDISLSHRFEEQIVLMESNKLDICGSHYLLVDQNNNINGLNITPLSHEMCFLSLAAKVPFAHPSVMMRKGFLTKHNLLYGQSQYTIAEDFDLWMRMYEHGAKFGNVNDILLRYRILDNSLSKVNSVGLARDTKKMLNTFLKKNKDKLFNILENLPQGLNSEEKALVVRTVYKLLVKNCNLSSIRFLKLIDNKTVVCTVLSEMVNR